MENKLKSVLENFANENDLEPAEIANLILTFSQEPQPQSEPKSIKYRYMFSLKEGSEKLLKSRIDKLTEFLASNEEIQVQLSEQTKLKEQYLPILHRLSEEEQEEFLRIDLAIIDLENRKKELMKNKDKEEESIESLKKQIATLQDVCEKEAKPSKILSESEEHKRQKIIKYLNKTLVLLKK